MFGHVTTSVDMETFVTAASRLERVCTRGSREETGGLIFSIFAEGTDTLTEKALTGLICSSATLALVLGSELHHHQTGVPPDHTHISALIRSAWKMTESETHQLSLKEFNFWSSTHCPRLLDGLLHWITSSLLLINLEGEGQGADHHSLSSLPPTQAASSSHYYRLPTPHLTGSEDQSAEAETEIQVLIWSLSISLPLIYLGHRDDENMTTKACVTTHWEGPGPDSTPVPSTGSP
ncbi:hypothetical protein GBAR_LOCUS29200 [Geodia barretti]|nr:hypothetical protein GBAR_LOCUS29200 [Geodia barretti]